MMFHLNLKLKVIILVGGSPFDAQAAAVSWPVIASMNDFFFAMKPCAKSNLALDSFYPSCRHRVWLQIMHIIWLWRSQCSQLQN